jgi:hypothetical protein
MDDNYDYARPGALPKTLQINAWTATTQSITTELEIQPAKRWALRGRVEDRRHLAPPPPADFRQWWDPRVGWGVIVPELANVDRCTPDDGQAGVPEPVRRLIAVRADRLKSPVPIFRYLRDWPERSELLRNRVTGQDASISGSSFGVGRGQIPYYLLIVGSPAQIPWEFQYLLNATHGVGRLDLPEEGLNRYVDALLNDFAEGASDPKRALVWSVDYGADDITTWMSTGIARPVYENMAQDPGISAELVSAEKATHAALIDRLAKQQPRFVLTTSHGNTGPLDGTPNSLKESLGLLVDQSQQVLNIKDLLAEWSPGGAIWYAHACCSAGGDSKSIFEDLVRDGPVKNVLQQVAAQGALTAPLPTALLSAPRPLRAFVGHVEPTFDWTLKQRQTGQFVTSRLQQALYNELYSGYPIGYALRRWYAGLGGLFASHDDASRHYAAGEDTEGIILATLLAARDTSSTVILGDPTAAVTNSAVP